MYFVPILTTSLFMVITCMNLNGDLCWMNMTIRWERELGLSTFRNRPDIVGFGDNLSAENVFLVGRGLVSFQKKKKKDSHKLVWPSNYINIRLGWEFLKTIWVGKSFLGRRPYNLTCMLFELLTTCTKETIVVEFLDSFEFLWKFKGKNFVSSRNNFVKVLFRFLCGWVFFQNIGVRG